MLRLLALAPALAACGRLGFEASPDAASNGAEADTAPALCTHMFCDDFEDPSFSAWTGANLDGAGTAVHDATFGRTGGSLKVTAPNGSAEADRWVDVFPAPQVADQWVRVMLFAPSGQMLDFEPVSMMDGGRAQELVIGLYDTGIDVHAHGIAADFNESRTTPPPRDRWVCLELHVHFATAGLVDLYLDGVQVLQRAISTQPAAGTALRRVAVGVTSKPTPLPHTVWIDDVAIDITRIGCP